MSARTKSILLVVATLIVGMILGAIINGMIVRHKWERMQSMRHPGGLANFVDELVGATPEQREELDAILEKHHAAIRKRMEETRYKMGFLIDSLHQDLGRILSESQLEKLEHHLKRLKEKGFMRPSLMHDHLLEKLTKQLGLTEDQIDEVRSILEEKQGSGRGPVRRGRMPRHRMRAELEKIKDILTEEQLTKWDAFMDDMMRNRPSRPF